MKQNLKSLIKEVIKEKEINYLDLDFDEEKEKVIKVIKNFYNFVKTIIKDEPNYHNDIKELLEFYLKETLNKLK